MARVTTAQVAGIIEVDEDIRLTPFIEAADELVTELCLESGYSSSRLRLISLWLSAHFYAIRDPRVASEGAGGVDIRYQHKVGMGLQVTTYGQQVMILDTDGSLASLNKTAEEGTGKAVVGISWLGTEEDEDE